MLQFIRKHAQKAVALFFLAILLMGFLTVKGYGLAWDDLGELKILRMALQEYNAILPWDTVYGRALDEMGIQRISESIERDHGICMYYPLFWAVCTDAYSPQQVSLIWRCHTWAIFTLGLFALYAVARRMGFSRLLSITGVLFMLLSPRFFAEGHYNNKDIVLMALTLVLLWQSVRLMETPTWRCGISFALAAGLCAATRVIGIAYCGLFGLMIIAFLWYNRRQTLKIWGIGLMTFALSCGVYILLTPSFLAAPGDFILHLLKNAVGFSRWHNSILYFGEVISYVLTKAPRSYLPVMFAITTPLWMIALLIFSCVHAVRAGWARRISLLEDSRSTVATFCFLSWILPLFACIVLHTLVYNGWRHVYFLYGPMVLCMLYGLKALYNVFSGRVLLQKFLVLGTIACLAWNSAGIAMNHPYQYGYYNLLVPRENRASLLELDWWNLSCTTALDKLLEQTDGIVTVAASDRNTYSGLALGSDYVREPHRVDVIRWGENRQPQYILSNLSYAAIAEYEPAENMRPVVSLSSYGADMTVIYECLP